MKQVKQYAWLRLLLAAFLMYMAFPSMEAQANSTAHLFWFSWLGFFLLVIGANLAIVLRIDHHSQHATSEINVPKRMKN
ncbi:hypothetical protein BN1058_02472 [Paraliobacillus sp. PM-2]|uniref:hypothetical protein n=1 Tax=Paraliobacillus sp. PM-2 TaxID=1462524 RepID=UPI00061CCD3E|nr:hypothetical protein [Paraliobacillus sp. PM-2]CQR48125.1 hypothetical protein BN1058_02472 [Paraliobacillus sp. PM-2]